MGSGEDRKIYDRTTTRVQWSHSSCAKCGEDCTPPYPKYYRLTHIKSTNTQNLPYPRYWLFKMPDEHKLNRKLLENPRIQNQLCFPWGTQRSLFYDVNANLSFGNRVTLSVIGLNFSRLTHKLTNRQMNKTNCLTPSTCTCGVTIVYLHKLYSLPASFWISVSTAGWNPIYAA